MSKKAHPTQANTPTNGNSKLTVKAKGKNTASHLVRISNALTKSRLKPYANPQPL